MKEANEILRQLNQKNIQPVYFLQGEEAYFIDLISDWIEKNVLSDADKGFNQTILYGKETDVGLILQHAKQYPMMAEKRVVIVKEAQDIKDLGKESGEEALTKYLENPLSSTVLVFAHKNKSLDGRKALGKMFAKKAVYLTTKRLYENQVPDWINAFVQEKGFKINTKASNLVASSIGTNLSTVANELGKIFINIKQGEEINENHVEKNIGVSKEYNVFELNNALLSKDILKANKIIQYFDKNPKTAPLVVVVSNIFNTFCKLLIVHQTQDKSDSNLASKLGLNPFFVKDYKNAASRYNLAACVQIIGHIRDTDGKSKGIDAGNASDYDISKELIFKILHA